MIFPNKFEHANKISLNFELHPEPQAARELQFIGQTPRFIRKNVFRQFKAKIQKIEHCEFQPAFFAKQGNFVIEFKIEQNFSILKNKLWVVLVCIRFVRKAETLSEGAK